MKKLFILLMTALPLAGWSQAAGVQSIYDKYSGEDGYVTVEVTGQMLSLISRSQNANIPAGVEKLQLVVQERASDGFYREVEAALSGHEKMVALNDPDQRTGIYHRKVGKRSEFVVLSQDEQTTLLIISGENIDIKKISGLSLPF